MANRYWVGGAGTWNDTNTANWSTSSGGASGASVPGSADVAIFNASSGSGTVTVDSGHSAIGGLTLTGASITVFSGSAIKVSSGTVTLKSGLNTPLNATGSIALVSNGSTIDGSTINGSVICSDAMTANGITLGSGATLILKAGSTNTLTSVAWPTASGGSFAPALYTDSAGTRATVSAASGTAYVDYMKVKDIAFSGGATWYWGISSVDNGNNTGITTPPASSSAVNALFLGEVA